MKLSNNHNNNSEEETKDKFSSAPDSFERRKAVVESTKETFKGFNRNNCKGRCYILWLDADDITFRDLSVGTLEKELIRVLYVKGFEIGSIKLEQGKPKDGNPTECKKNKYLDVEMFLQETTNTPPPLPPGKIMKARITLAPNSPGALKQPEGYVINSELAPYNIGRVIEPGDGISRVNHIEIEDDTNRVSRIQMHIGYEANIGFYIQLDRNLKGTNRTKRIRKGNALGLDSPASILGLKDGDYIELSHQVVLMFNELTND